MPVTAKLSRNFYEKLGDDVATELVEWFNSVDATYRADLRELNELNFARFDAKVEQRLAASEARLSAQIDRRIGEVRAEMHEMAATLRVEMHQSLATLRAELIKWAFVFFATAALAVIGLR
jgi:hypothetical protein